MRLTRLGLTLPIAIVILLAPLGAAAQGSKVPPRIGILRLNPASSLGTGLIRRALGDLGYVEGQNIVVDWRFADGQTDRLPSLAAELARLHPDAIVTTGDLSVRAVRQAAAGTPIIAGSDDLVGEGHAASLARPGGNVTGVSILAPELNAKRLSLLKEAVPSAARIAVLWDPTSGKVHLPGLEAAARSLGVELKILDVQRREDLDRMFKAAREWRAKAVNVLASPLLTALQQPIIDLAARHRLPSIYQWGSIAEAGGLMAYGPTQHEMIRTMVEQLDRVLKGSKPADLPVLQPTRFELVINLKAAKALGLTIPQSVLFRADRVIQ